MMDDDLQVPLTNREKKKKPSSYMFICGSCNCGVVTSGAKCNVCSRRDLSKQAKKRDIKVYDTN